MTEEGGQSKPQVGEVLLQITPSGVAILSLKCKHPHAIAVVTGGIRHQAKRPLWGGYIHHPVKRMAVPLGIWTVCRSISSRPRGLEARANNPFHSI